MPTGKARPMPEVFPEPTAAQCDTHADMSVGGRRAVATWLYPKMGGYAAKCWVVPRDVSPGCFDVWIWHNGQFPFTGNDMAIRPLAHDDRPPVVLHHCDPEQFVAFGEFAARVVAGDDVSRKPIRRVGPDLAALLEGKAPHATGPHDPLKGRDR